MKRLMTAVVALGLLAGCQNSEERAQDRVDDRIEETTGIDASQQQPSPGALGLTERELLDADLINASGEDLGDIEAVRRDESGAITSLVIELDDTDPDRWVEIPIEGLSTQRTGDDIDIVASMTRDELASYPDTRL